MAAWMGAQFFARFKDAFGVWVGEAFARGDFAERLTENELSDFR